MGRGSLCGLQALERIHHMAGGLAEMSRWPTQVSPGRDLEGLPLRISLQPGDCGLDRATGG